MAVRRVDRRTSFSAADDTANMFQLLVEHEAFFLGSRNPRVARELDPQLETFAAWNARCARSIPVLA